MTGKSPTVRQRELGKRLRELRSRHALPLRMSRKGCFALLQRSAGWRPVPDAQAFGTSGICAHCMPLTSRLLRSLWTSRGEHVNKTGGLNTRI